MKRTAHVVRSQTMRCVKSYLNGTSILDLARRCNYPPSMMARLVVENVARTSSSPSPSSPSPSTPADTAPAATFPTSAVGTASGYLDDGDADEAAAAAATAAARTTDSTNGNNRGGGSDKVIKRFLTTALRYPEKTLGDARASVSPEYLFSERNCAAAAANAASSRDDDRDGDDVEDHRDLPRERRLPVTTTAMPPPIPLSRLSKEVREAVDSDPMYGESLGFVGFRGFIDFYFFRTPALFLSVWRVNFSNIQKTNDDSNAYPHVLGPRQDRERHNIGIEYESLLEETLQSMGELRDSS